MKTCPFCAEEIQDAAIVCKHCGRDLPQPQELQANVVSWAEDKKEKKKANKAGLYVLLAIVLIAAAFGGIYYYVNYLTPCGVGRVQDSMAKLTDIHNRWFDAIEIASSTSRISLSGPVADLQAIYRETEKLEIAPCLTQAKMYLTQSMDWTLESFQRFMAQDEDSSVNSAMEQATKLLSKYTDEIIRVKACMPNNCQ